MIRSIRTYSYLFGFLPLSLPLLRKIRKLPDDLPTYERDQYVDQYPRHWAQGILNRTKSEIYVEGLEHLTEEPAMIICNHEGNFDIPTLIATLPKPFGFISKVEVKKLPVIRDWMEEMNCIFLDRSDRRSAMQVLTDAKDSLEAGHSLVMFPEGTRSQGGDMQPFKSGFAKIAQDAGVQVIPVVIRGTSQVMEQHNNWIHPARIDVQVLPPLTKETVSSYSRKALVELAEQTMRSAWEQLKRKREQEEKDVQ